jgi:hypothetical protein
MSFIVVCCSRLTAVLQATVCLKVPGASGDLAILVLQVLYARSSREPAAVFGVVVFNYHYLNC